tara:strand:- start:54 stop:155 length:102 start_codon:yes stop_codon:yes gene_type:complete
MFEGLSSEKLSLRLRLRLYYGCPLEVLNHHNRH